ncbi:hypothetical protein HC256_005522 [Beauveria bassiana]|nr:hypothetical protein HC256_005522 [Beauveria bassiana]
MPHLRLSFDFPLSSIYSDRLFEPSRRLLFLYISCSFEAIISILDCPHDDTTTRLPRFLLLSSHHLETDIVCSSRRNRDISSAYSYRLLLLSSPSPYFAILP